MGPLSLCVYGCLQHRACLELARVAPVPSLGAMKVAMLCDLADRNQAFSSLEGKWLKPDQ